eukprot:9211420-Pyramimonas_sp.AAC.1
MPCAEWYTSVDSRRLSTVKLKSKAFLASLINKEIRLRGLQVVELADDTSEPTGSCSSSSLVRST